MHITYHDRLNSIMSFRFHEWMNPVCSRNCQVRSESETARMRYVQFEGRSSTHAFNPDSEIHFFRFNIQSQFTDWATRLFRHMTCMMLDHSLTLCYCKHIAILDPNGQAFVSMVRMKKNNQSCLCYDPKITRITA